MYEREVYASQRTERISAFEGKCDWAVRYRVDLTESLSFVQSLHTLHEFCIHSLYCRSTLHLSGDTSLVYFTPVGIDRQIASLCNVLRCPDAYKK